MKLKTFIRYTGNKSKQLKHILPHIPKQYNTYIEPFVGSGAVFLALQPDKWIINDLNKDLINCWKSVKNEPESIIEIFKEFGKEFKPMTNREKIDYCRDITRELEHMEYDIVRTGLYMLMKYCVYMGNIFVKNKFYFNSLDLPITLNNKYFFLESGIHTNILNISDYLNLSTYNKIYNEDYKKILSTTRKGDFIFLDPPYTETHDYQFNYNKDEILDNKFIDDLYKEVCKLDEKHVKWMMTQADTKKIRDVFRKYNILKYPVYRRLNKSYSYELLIMNY